MENSFATIGKRYHGLEDRHLVILYDGQCFLCDYSVRFLSKRDRRDRFRFLSLQDAVGAGIRFPFPYDAVFRTFFVITPDGIHKESSAVLKLCGYMTGVWPVMKAAYLIPPFLRDFLYRVISRYRYRWFGRSETCILPQESVRKKLLI